MTSFTEQKQFWGWLQGIIAVFIFLGLNQVFGRYATVILEVNPVVFSCATFTSSAFVLLLIGGSGPLSKETMRSVDTWIYGIVLMISYITGMILYGYITSTELTMLQKISVGLSFLGSWFFMGRNPDKFQILGTTIITIGVIVVALNVPTENKGIIYLLSAIYGVVQAARIFVAELHRPHTKAASISDKDPKARARVIGFVMLIVSTLFIAIFSFVAFSQQMAGEPFLKNFPMPIDFMHPQSILSGMVAGVFLMAPLRMLEFSSSQIIKAENFITLLTFMTISTLFWEWVTAPITGLSIKGISGSDLAAAFLITVGGLLISLTRHRKKKHTEFKEFLIYSGQDLDLIDDSREIIANTIEHFNGDIKKAATALNIPDSILVALLKDKEKVLAFKPDVLKEVARNYRRKVAMSDALTGLANRAGFMTVLKGAAYEADIYSLLFIDLNKFKPVNDTYGHDAGDAILKGVAERLSILFPKRACVTRLGGDEFAVLLLDSNKEQAETFVSNIKEILSEPFDFKGTEIIIGASVGIATYPYDGTDPEKLLKQADEGMYREKSER